VEVFVAALLSTLAGGLLAIAMMALRRDLGRSLRRYGDMIVHIILAREVLYIPPEPGETAGQRMVYAPAIAAGTAASLWWFSEFDPVLRHLGGAS
jgi:prepilin peptidase CpaA